MVLSRDAMPCVSTPEYDPNFSIAKSQITSAPFFEQDFYD
ncbi:hypothetical protein CYPRO_0865 [Cyclonatronum proteinivorum]|uniref:Uncharacterized protein n=1 Tax=Cyclonatronum proteinivorum TaxID=1457365 RepID=A0A345UI40_9BACT|nr:hypothetical protein CYPRO_0865 [Cyclonatronum proteinivorum]